MSIATIITIVEGLLAAAPQVGQAILAIEKLIADVRAGATPTASGALASKIIADTQPLVDQLRHG